MTIYSIYSKWHIHYLEMHIYLCVYKHTQSLQPINGRKVVIKKSFTESGLSFHFPFLSSSCGCRVGALLSAQECFALHCFPQGDPSAQ